MSSLASIPLLLITEDKGGSTPGHKTKIHFCLVEAGTSGFSIFGERCEEVEEIYRAQTKTPIILLYEIWVTQHSITMKHYEYIRSEININKFLDAQVIQRGHSHWSVPIIVVSKGDGENA